MLVAEYTIPGMQIRDHLIPVPLDWSKPDGPCIELFAREVVDPVKTRDELPVLCFLQGGPGGKSPRPTRGAPAWLKEALKSYRVILPDQRGTGRSSAIDPSVISSFSNGEDAADYLLNFRADSIVRDFEHLRGTLFGNRRWQTLGQSYGGFLTLTYLSQYPGSLSACYIAGGLPSIFPSADEVYRRTYPRVAAKNQTFYSRFPHVTELLQTLADFIEQNSVLLPDGDTLTVKRLQSVGLDFGMGDGFENVHWLLNDAFANTTNDRLSDAFLTSVMNLTSFRGNQLFAALHEAIYAQGDAEEPWSASRILSEFPDFNPERRPLLFTGEMIYPWMFEEIAALRPYRPAVDSLVKRSSYSALYDAQRLRANEVPVSAVVYHDDMYVDALLSLETAKAVGNTHYWITNQFEHDGIRESDTVFQMLKSYLDSRGGPLAVV